MNEVDVSVLITNFNHGKYLPECLEAVYSQSVKPKEIIVIDDASSDDSVPWVLEFQKRHPELVFLQNAMNQGPQKAMNAAIRHAKGKYLVLAAADDRILPGILEQGAALLDKHPDAGICCSEPTFFHSGRPNSFFRIPISYEKKVIALAPERILKNFLFSPLWIPTHAALYRRDLILRYGCLEENLKHLCDWYLNCKIAINHGIVYTPESFGAFRLSSQSYGAKWNRSYRKKFDLYEHLFSMLSNEPESYQKLFARAGALGLISADVLFYAFIHPTLWKYLPCAFYRKTWNFFRKINRRWDKK